MIIYNCFGILIYITINPSGKYYIWNIHKNEVNKQTSIETFFCTAY